MDKENYIDNILLDITSKLNINISKDDLFFFTDGASDSIVFKLKNKYLVKAMDDITFKTQLEFLTLYSNISYFQKIICLNTDLKYICFEFIDGECKKIIPQADIPHYINILKDIVSQYKKYSNEGYGYLYEENNNWYEFLKDEVDYSKKEFKDLNIDYEIVDYALENIKKYSIVPKLIHGDFGFHNFIINNNSFKVIDPMPVIGDYLYDFYFALLSNASVLKNLDITYILSLFENENSNKKFSLYTVVLFIRMCRCHKYDIKNFDIYLNLYNNIKKKDE